MAGTALGRAAQPSAHPWKLREGPSQRPKCAAFSGGDGKSWGRRPGHSVAAALTGSAVMFLGTETSYTRPTTHPTHPGWCWCLETSALKGSL